MIMHCDSEFLLDQLDTAASRSDGDLLRTETPKLVLDLATLTTPERLQDELLRLTTLGSRGARGGVDFFRGQTQLIAEQCQAVCDEIHAGTYHPQTSFWVPPDCYAVTPDPIRHGIDWAVATLLAGPVDTFVTSLLPDSVIPTGRIGVWTMLHAIKRAARDYPWRYVRVERIEGLPQEIYLPHCVADMHEYIEDPIVWRLLGAVLSETGDRLGIRGLRGIPPAHPLTMAAVQLRLHHALRGVSCFDLDYATVTLRYEDTLVVFGAEDYDPAVTHMDMYNALNEAGHDAFDKPRVVDLRKKDCVFHGIAVESAYDKVRYSTADAAFEDLAVQLRFCHFSIDPHLAAEKTLAGWILEHAPVWKDEPDDGHFSRIQTALSAAGFRTLVADRVLDDLMGDASEQWHRFVPTQDPASLIGEAITRAKLGSEQSTVDRQAIAAALA